MRHVLVSHFDPNRPGAAASGEAVDVRQVGLALLSVDDALRKLEQKLQETRSRCEMMIAQHRRARVVGKAHKAQQAVESTKRLLNIHLERAVLASLELELLRGLADVIEPPAASDV